MPNPKPDPILPTSHTTQVFVPLVPDSFISWTYGRGTVFWRIWPVVLLYTIFAAVIVFVSIETPYNLGIPNVMLTVVGVVIGFVIAYRASSGYDRYWAGRMGWSDVVKNCRVLGRLVWIHVPLKSSLTGTGNPPDQVQLAEDERHILEEKKVVMNMIEGFAVALKHHLRGEMEIFYEDLYPLIVPLHSRIRPMAPLSNPVVTPVAINPPSPILTENLLSCSPPPASAPLTVSFAPLPHLDTRSYGTFPITRDVPSLLAVNHIQQDAPQLLPSSTPPPIRPTFRSLLSFPSITGVFQYLTPRRFSPVLRDGELGAPAPPPPSLVADPTTATQAILTRTVSQSKTRRRGTMGIGGSTKHRPLVAGGGENIPLEILRCLSEWIAVLESRGTVPGAAVGGMHGCISGFEDSLGALERILTTPLPFVYAAHIRHTVWIYLFFLPFQLTETFGYLAIPGVAVAAFLYLGFLAAGEEIEQPFGYDFNDLQLDLYCREIIHRDLIALMRTSCINSTLTGGSSMETNRIGAYGTHSIVEVARNQQGKQLQNITSNITGLIFE